MHSAPLGKLRILTKHWLSECDVHDAGRYCYAPKIETTRSHLFLHSEISSSTRPQDAHVCLKIAVVWFIRTGGMLYGKRIGREQDFEVGFGSSPRTGPVCSAQSLRNVHTQVTRGTSARAATHNITERATPQDPLLLRAHQCQDMTTFRRWHSSKPLPLLRSFASDL